MLFTIAQALLRRVRLGYFGWLNLLRNWVLTQFMSSLVPFLERPKKRRTIPLDANPLSCRYVLCFGVINAALVWALE